MWVAGLICAVAILMAQLTAAYDAWYADVTRRGFEPTTPAFRGAGVS